MGKILQQDKPRNHGDIGSQSTRRGVRRPGQALPLLATKTSDMPLEDQGTEGPPYYKHIERNEFLHRGHKKLKEEDIPVCVCNYIPDDSESVCGERCLNFLTSTECTPGYCPCGDLCKNQRFQRCEYVKTKLFKTDGRGWGLLADQDIKVGQFIIEYCGEVISCKEARLRSQAYEAEGLKDAFIIYLNASESIDATRKGSLARFINHSCDPNCETRKWTVLGEIRVGIFAKQDICSGAELAYDYNFEWYGGTKVRCRCGAPSCLGFLGAKSRGFQKDAYLWEDDDERYSVENVPLYDSEDDEPLSNFLRRAMVCKKLKSAAAKGHSASHPVATVGTSSSDTIPFAVDQKKLSSNVSVNEDKSTLLALAETAMWDGRKELVNGALDQKTEVVEKDEDVESAAGKEIDILNSEQCSTSRHIRMSENGSVRAYLGDCSEPQFPLSNEKSLYFSCQKSKHLVNKRVSAEFISQILPSKEAREEVLAAEEAKIAMTAQLNSLYDEIRPVIEEHGRDGQDSVPISYAEKWIQASCEQLKATFDVHFTVVKHLSNNFDGIHDAGVKLDDNQDNLTKRAD